MTCDRIGRTTGLAWLVVVIGACGGGGGSHPDASVGHELSISLFKHLPFADGDTAPAALVAVQDGDAAWTAVTGEQGVYRAHLASDRYGVAIGCRDGASSSVQVFQRAAEDGLELRARACSGAAVELDVAVAHVPEGSIAYLVAAGQSASGDGDTTYVLQGQPGPAELFASLSDAGGRISRLVRMPAFDLAAARTVQIDFWLEGAAPEDRDLAVALAAGEQGQVTTSVIRPTGAYLLSAGSAIGAPATYQMLPAALQQPDDLFEVAVAVGARSAAITSKAPGALALQLPPELTAPAPTIALAPTLHPVFSFEPRTGELALQRHVLEARTLRSPDDAFRDWRVELSAAWLAGAGSVTYALPDLSTASDAASEFALFTGPVRWAVRHVETSTDAATSGRITRSASRSGTIDMYCGDGVIQPPETCDPPDGAACSATCAKL